MHHFSKGPQKVFAFHACVLCMEGSLSCHTCFDREPHFFAVSLEGPSNIVAFYDKQGVPMTHSNLDSYGEGGTYIHVLTPSNFESKWGLQVCLWPPFPIPRSTLCKLKTGKKTYIYMHCNWKQVLKFVEKKFVKRFFVSVAILRSFRPKKSKC